jgi:hypothetical protein
MCCLRYGTMYSVHMNMKGNEMTRPWGTYTLTITKDGKAVKTVEYTKMSGHAMMDAAFYWRSLYPESEGYSVDW